MSDQPNDGGPAFPVPERENGNGDTVWPIACGMSLRDYFAAQALSGVMADPNGWNRPANTAANAYDYADAMLAERAKRGAA